MRRLILGSLIVLSMVVLPAVPTMAKGDHAQIDVFVADGRTPLSGARVRLLPRKPPTATKVLAEATTDDKGHAEFTTAKGAGLPLAVIKKTAGVRIVVSLAGYEDMTKEVYDDELSVFTEQPTMQDFFLRKPPPPALSLVLRQTVADLYKLSAKGLWRVSPTGFSTREDKDTGEALTFVLLQGPPAEIRSGQELVISVEGKVERPRFDYWVRVCWELQPDQTDDCPLAVKSGRLTIGLNSETNKVTPSGKADFRVQVPADLTGGRAALILEIGYGLDEPRHDEWVRFEYGPK